MFQRLDRMRKHAFGSVILFGENNNSTISGVWFWRGQDLAFEVSCSDSWFIQSTQTKKKIAHKFKKTIGSQKWSFVFAFSCQKTCR